MAAQQSFEDLHIVRRIRQMVRRWWSIELAFADETGFVTDHEKGLVVPPHNPICQSCLRQKEGFSRCNQSVEKAIVQLQRKADLTQRAGPCHMGIDVVAVPVVVDETYRGAMFTCGVLLDDSPERRQQVVANARALGLERDIPDLDRAYDRIARLDARDFDYLKDLLAATASEVSEVTAQQALRDARIEALSAELQGRHRFGSLVGKSPAMQRLFAMLQRVVESDATVLVTGENGTGKELIARALHYNGPRKSKPFVAQNCGALNDNLLESELFGHVKGAFTGAIREKQGLFATADSGTFFLDEIGDTSASMQLKLLGVLQRGEFTPVGGTKPAHVDVRIIAATNRPLAEMIQKRTFREDLFYRLNVIHVEVPPLRDRLEDLPLLCDHFLARAADRFGMPVKRLSPDVMGEFYASRWPGNVRELENTIERLVVLAGEASTIGADLLHLGARSDDGGRSTAKYRDRGDLAGAVRAVERDLIESGLIATHWNKSKLAEKLGISRTTLIKKIKEFGLEDREER